MDLYKQIVENASVGYAYHRIIFDEKNNPIDYEFIEANEAYERITGRSAKDIVGKRASEILPVLSQFDFDWLSYYKQLNEGQRGETFTQYSRPLHRWYYVEAFCPEKGSFVVLCNDVEQTYMHVFRDRLTGLGNAELLFSQLKRVDTQKIFPASVVYMDIDGLRGINSTLGYGVGNKVIISSALLLQEMAGENGIAFRVHGDELALLLYDTEETADQVCQEFARKVQMVPEIKPLNIHFSMGTASKKRVDEQARDVLYRAIDNMYLEKLVSLSSSRGVFLVSLLHFLENKSFETLQHTNRLEKHVVKIAKAISLHRSQIDELILLAKLHDIGKIIIPEHILNKKEKLTDEEWELIKTHCRAGYDFFIETLELKTVAQGILAHHERWDGKGYPLGLAGEEIPLLSRVLCVVDSYDAMTQERPYKAVMSKAEAVEELKRCAGGQFDPQIVEIFLRILQEEKTG